MTNETYTFNINPGDEPMTFTISISAPMSLSGAQPPAAAPVLPGPATYTTQSVIANGNLPASTTYTPTADTTATIFLVGARGAASFDVSLNGVSATRLAHAGLDTINDGAEPDIESTATMAAFLVSNPSAGTLAVTVSDIDGAANPIPSSEVYAIDVAAMTVRSVFVGTDNFRLPTESSNQSTATVSDVDWSAGDLVLDFVMGREPASMPGSIREYTFNNESSFVRGAVFAQVPDTAATAQTRTSAMYYARGMGLITLVASVNQTVSIYAKPERFRDLNALVAGDSSKTVTLVGGYYGTPAGVQVRVLDASDDSEVVTWTTATASANEWSADVTIGRADRDLYLQMRETGQSKVFTDKTPFTVGWNVLLYGQSPIVYWELAGQPVSAEWVGTRPLGLRAYDAQKFDSPGYSGKPATRAFAKKAAVPTMTTNMAVSSSTIAALSKGGAIYSDMIAQMGRLGKHITYLGFVQGEADTISGNDGWAAAAEQLRSDIETDLSQTTGSLKMVVFGLGWSTLPGYTDAGWAGINDEILEAANTYPNIFYGGSRADETLQDEVHGDGDSQSRTAERMAHAMRVLDGIEATPAPFSIASAEKTNASTTTITLDHGIGTDFTTTGTDAPIVGFEVSGDGFDTTTESISAVRATATTITLTHDAIGMVNTRHVRYLYGKNTLGSTAPGGRDGIVIDNSVLAMPLTPLTIMEAV